MQIASIILRKEAVHSYNINTYLSKSRIYELTLILYRLPIYCQARQSFPARCILVTHGLYITSPQLHNVVLVSILARMLYCMSPLPGGASPGSKRGIDSKRCYVDWLSSLRPQGLRNVWTTLRNADTCFFGTDLTDPSHSHAPTTYSNQTHQLLPQSLCIWPHNLLSRQPDVQNINLL